MLKRNSRTRGSPKKSRRLDDQPGGAVDSAPSAAPSANAPSMDLPQRAVPASSGDSSDSGASIPIHSIRHITSDRRNIYKLPLTKLQEQFADGYFEDYIARDFLGLGKKKEKEDEERAKARARAARRRRELLALIAAPCAVTHAFYKRKREEYRLYRQGKRKVTNRRRKRFVLFCHQKQVSNIRKYIKSGHPVNDADASGRTGMHHAAAAGHAAVIRELLKRGGTVDPKEYTRNVTPFWYSALIGDLSSGELLINARCDVDACDALNRQTPLMLCAIGNFLNFAERLIEEGAFLTMQDEIGMTPLHHAAYHGA